MLDKLSKNIFTIREAWMRITVFFKKLARLAAGANRQTADFELL